MPLFGNNLGDIVADNDKVPSVNTANNDSYLLVVNTANKATNKMLASEFMKGWDETVATFNDLPDVVLNNGKLYLVTTRTGVWPNRKHAGLYVSNGITWSRLGVLQGILTESTPLSTLSESATSTNLIPSDTPLTAFGKVKKYFSDYLTTFNGANQLIKLDSSGNMPSSATLDTITAGTTNKHFTATEKTKLSGIESGATADQTNAEIKAAYEANSDTNAYSDSEKTKLSGVQSGATVNSTDAELRARSSHTGVQSISTITGLQSALDDKVDESQVLTNVPENAVFTDTTYGVGDGGLTQENFTSTLKAKLEGIETGADVNTVDSVAGKTGVVTLAKADVGLNQVDNTSDANKPISTATQTALNTKEPSFSKNTGFNKNFGTSSDTVCEGDDSRLSNSRKWNATINTADKPTARTNLDVYSKSESAIQITNAKNRGNHTGTQAINTVDGLQGALDDKVNSTRVLTDVPANAVFTDTPTPVINNLTSNSTTSALSAKQGKDLKGFVDGKEPLFSKNNAFNKAFGAGTGQVCQGNDSRLSNSRQCNNNFDNTDTAKTNLGLSTVASSGSYNDLSNKPSIPSQVTVEDNVSSTSTTNALSANQGRLLSNKNSLHQRLRLSSYNMSGGGTITWENNNLSTSQRIIWIPSGNGGGDHWNLNLSNLNVPAWNVAYIRMTESETTSGWTKNQSNVSVTSYVSYVPNDRDLIIGHHNGDNGIFIFASGLNTNLAPKFHSHTYLDLTGKQFTSHMPDYFRMDYDSGWIPLQNNYYAWRWHGLGVTTLLTYAFFKNSDGVIFPVPFGKVSTTAKAGFFIEFVDANQFYVFAERDYVFATHYYRKPDGSFEWSEANNKWTSGHVKVVLKRFST